MNGRVEPGELDEVGFEEFAGLFWRLGGEGFLHEFADGADRCDAELVAGLGLDLTAGEDGAGDGELRGAGRCTPGEDHGLVGVFTLWAELEGRSLSYRPAGGRRLLDERLVICAFEEGDE